MMLYHFAVAFVVFNMTFAYKHIGHHQGYAFGYAIKDPHGEQHRIESGDFGHSVKGSYGFKDDRGIYRQVHYIADKSGFRAEVKTNEPGTENQNPADVQIHASAHPYFDKTAGHRDYGEYGYGHGGHVEHRGIDRHSYSDGTSFSKQGFNKGGYGRGHAVTGNLGFVGAVYNEKGHVY